MKKLNTNGFAHSVALAVVVVLTAVAGTYYLVASKADSCSANSVSGVTSAPVSGQKCDSVSAPVSAPASSPTPPPKPTPSPTAKVVSASCSVSAMPENPKLKQFITPAVTITNTGNQPFSTTYTSTVWPRNKAGNNINKQMSSITSKVKDLQPGKSVRQSLQSFVVRKPVNNEASVYFNVLAASPSFTCRSTSVKLP